MTEDARFEDGADRPVRLAALDAEDLRVISALVQDSVLDRHRHDLRCPAPPLRIASEPLFAGKTARAPKKAGDF